MIIWSQCVHGGLYTMLMMNCFLVYWLFLCCCLGISGIWLCVRGVLGGVCSGCGYSGCWGSPIHWWSGYSLEVWTCRWVCSCCCKPRCEVSLGCSWICLVLVITIQVVWVTLSIVGVGILVPYCSWLGFLHVCDIMSCRRPFHSWKGATVKNYCWVHQSMHSAFSAFLWGIPSGLQGCHCWFASHFIVIQSVYRWV